MNILQGLFEFNLLALAAILVLFVPGYLLTQTFFGPGTIGVAERVTLYIGLSIVVCIVAGLLLQQLRWGVSAGAWIVLISLIAAVCLRLARENIVGPFKSTGAMLRRAEPSQVLVLAIAAALTVGALLVSVNGAVAQEHQKGFTQLWIEPNRGLQTGHMTIGVRNVEHEQIQYSLQVLADNQVLHEIAPFELASGDMWSVEIDPRGSAMVRQIEVRLYRSDRPNVIYRRVAIRQ